MFFLSYCFDTIYIVKSTINKGDLTISTKCSGIQHNFGRRIL